MGVVLAQGTINQVERLIKSQFDTMSELANEIRRLNEDGQKDQAAKLARILDRLSEDSLRIWTAIRDRRA